MVLIRAFLIEARKAFPNAKITLSISSHYTRDFPEDLANKVHIVHGQGDKTSLIEKIIRIRELGTQDIIFDLATTNRSLKTCILNKAKLKIGFPSRMIQARFFYDVATCRSDLNFEVNDMLNQLHIFGVKTACPHEYDMPGTPVKRPRPFIIYFTGGSVQIKCWPEQKFSELIAQMSSKHSEHCPV